MSDKKNTEIAANEGFAALANRDVLNEAVADDCQGLEFSIDRVNLPAGGTAFEIPSAESDESERAKDITGVIVYNHPALMPTITISTRAGTILPTAAVLVEEIESPTAVYLGIMKTNGISVNLPLMQERKTETEAEMERIRKEIEFIIGDVNIGANRSTQAFKNYLYKDLGLPILKAAETNREAADNMTMTLLKEWCDANRPELSELFTLVQEYRKWGKIKSTYTTEIASGSSRQ